MPDKSFNKTKKEISKICGLSIRTIDRRVKDKSLRKGYHYTDYRGDDGTYQILRFNVEACQEFKRNCRKKR